MKPSLPWLTPAASCMLGLLLVGSASAKPPTAPGTYQDWNGDLDHVEIVQPFHLQAFHQVLVLPIDTTGLEMPTDNTRRPVEKTLAKSTAYFAEQLDDDLPNRMKVKAAVASSGAALNANPGTLFLRARFTEMNPGSSAARTFTYGFAGATHVTLQGEFLDGATGRVLLRFSHHNYHSKPGPFNLYTKALEENEDQIAKVVAKLLKAFYP